MWATEGRVKSASLPFFPQRGTRSPAMTGKGELMQLNRPRVALYRAHGA
jgi:hypothetical protein